MKTTLRLLRKLIREEINNVGYNNIMSNKRKFSYSEITALVPDEIKELEKYDAEMREGEPELEPLDIQGGYFYLAPLEFVNDRQEVSYVYYNSKSGWESTC